MLGFADVVSQEILTRVPPSGIIWDVEEV